MFFLFFKGLLMGLAIAAPVGPIGALCISRTLSLGFRAGVFTGLGAACADAVYGFIAALGLSVISSLLIDLQKWIHFIGGAFLMYLGLKLFLSPAQDQAQSSQEAREMRMFVSTFFLTLLNPATIFSFLAIFASVNLKINDFGHWGAFILVLGVFMGSVSWWLMLSGFIACIHHRLSKNILKRINQASGLFIMGFALFALK